MRLRLASPACVGSTRGAFTFSLFFFHRYEYNTFFSTAKITNRNCHIFNFSLKKLSIKISLLKTPTSLDFIDFASYRLRVFFIPVISIVSRQKENIFSVAFSSSRLAQFSPSSIPVLSVKKPPIRAVFVIYEDLHLFWIINGFMGYFGYLR